MLAQRKVNARLLAALLLCCTGVLAQTRPQGTSLAPAATEEPATGTISGSVVNEGGQPLAGVFVTVREISPGATRRSLITNSDGNFRVNGLLPALYSVSASLPAYVTEPMEFPSTHYRIGDTVRFEMFRGGVITGTVTNAAGEPVIGVRVRAALLRNAKGEAAPYGGFSGERTTDDRGIYRIFGLLPGTYVVSAGGATSSQPFFLNPYDTDVPTYAPSSTRDTAAEVSVRAGEESNADIRYRGEPGHVVSGSVKMTGPSNSSITLTAVDSIILTAQAFQMPGAQSFAFYGIADGEYDIVATEVKSPPRPPGAQPDLLRSEPQRIVVKGADITGLELVTRTLASISGRIVLETAKVPECAGKRRPLFTETLVTLRRPERDSNDKDTVPFRVLTSSASPDQNGKFLLPNLTAGRFQLEPRFFARYWYLNSISIGSRPKFDPAANWITLKSGDQLANVTITLAEGAASIRGKLSTANETDIPSGFGVYLLPAEREKAADVLRFFVTAAQADGTFALNNLPPGRYLSLVQPLDEQTSTVTKLRRPEAAEARTKLRRAAETQKKDLELKPCQNLTDYQLSAK